MEDALLDIVDKLERIATNMEKIEAHLKNNLNVTVNLDHYCVDGDPYIQVHGHIQTSQRF